MDNYSDLYYVEEQHKKHFCKKCGKEMEKRFTHMTENIDSRFFIHYFYVHCTNPKCELSNTHTMMKVIVDRWE
jgi:hypothetical protein